MYSASPSFQLSFFFLSLIAFTRSIYTRNVISHHTQVSMCMNVIYNRWSKKEIRELLVIDGWDKMMNGDRNKRGERKKNQERIIHHAERKEKRKLQTCI